MACKYTYKGKRYTEVEIKDLILEQDVLKNNPIITFTKKIFKTLPYQYKEDLLNEGSRKYGIERGESKATIKYSLADQNKINFGLKSVEILQSDKAKQIFDKGEKNKWDLNKILNELQVPKEQKQLILDKGLTNREDILTSLLAENSFVVEINTAKEKPVKQLNLDSPERFIDDFGNVYTRDYSSTHEGFDYFKNDNLITKQQFDKEYQDSLDDVAENQNTQYYSNLTVPGGTNYTEQEIATPAITPSIKGHAQFSTDKGIGWFRSDDKAIKWNEEERGYWNPYTEEVEIEDESFGEGSTKTRRILEVQSDIFQKGRDIKSPDEIINELKKSGELQIKCD